MPLQYTYACGEMRRFAGGGEQEDGLVKCFSVFVAHRSGCAAAVCSPRREQAAPFPSASSAARPHH